MPRKLLHAILGSLVLLIMQAGGAGAQNLNGEVIQVAADALTVLKFNSEIKRYELGDRNGYTCQVRDNDNSIVIKTLADSCSATNLIVTEGKRSHYFIIHFLKEIDINKTKLFYDYSDLKELRRLVNASDALAANTKEDKPEAKEEKTSKRDKKKEREEQEARDKEAQRLADEQKKKEQDAIAANEQKKREQEAIAANALKEKEAVASAAEPKAKKAKKRDKAKEPPEEPVAKPVEEIKTTGVNNNTATPYKEEPIASAQETGNKKSKKDKKGKAKQAEPKETVVAANTAVPDTSKAVTGQPVASTREPVDKKNKKGKTKQTETKEQTVVVANITAPDTSKAMTGQSIASVQAPADKKGNRDKKGKAKQPEPAVQPVIVENKPGQKQEVVASANTVKHTEEKTPTERDAKRDSIAQAKAELQKLIAKEKERQALLKKYPNINFAEPPDGQMLTGDFFLPTDTAENYTVSNEILKKGPGKLNVTSTNDKGLEVTLQSITFSGVNAYMRLQIRNKGKNEVPIGRMNVQWNKNNGVSCNLFACYVTSFPILAAGKETTIIYATRAVNATNADNFIFTMNDRQDKFSTSLSFGGDVYNSEMGWKP